MRKIVAGARASFAAASAYAADAAPTSTSAAGSSQRRQALLRRLELPEHLTANGMLEALNLLTDREELAELLQDQ